MTVQVISKHEVYQTVAIQFEAVKSDKTYEIKETGDKVRVVADKTFPGMCISADDMRGNYILAAKAPEKEITKAIKDAASEKGVRIGMTLFTPSYNGLSVFELRINAS